MNSYYNYLVYQNQETWNQSIRNELHTDFFLPGCVNIFTDASKQFNNDTCAIAVVMAYTDNAFQTSAFAYDIKFIKDSSIANAELSALAYGMFTFNAANYGATQVHVFSDSLNALDKIVARKNGIVESEVADIYVTEEAMVKSKNINVSMYHFKAHSTDVGYIKNIFRKYNHMDIKLYDISMIASYMAFIDTQAKVALKNELEVF